MRRLSKQALFVAAIGLSLCGCNDKAVTPPAADAAPPPAGLSEEQASRVLAKAGDRAITLGDFANTLERMDQFDRLRYQTKERRKELLDEMIDIELLAAEARKRGLDKQPETEEAIRQILRDAMLSKARQGLPAPAEITPEEVRAYYDANTEKWTEPERRRVSAIVLDDKKAAEKVLKEALATKTPAEWGELFFKHSVTAPKAKPQGGSVELAGDLGIVGAPDDAKGKNQKVPEPVRAALFKVAKVGDVLDSIVEADGKFWVIRLNGMTAAHKRTLQEADRSIRVAIIQQKMQEREKALEAELRKKFTVQIDDAALSKVKLPEGTKPMDGSEPSPWAPGSPEAADAGAGDGGK